MNIISFDIMSAFEPDHVVARVTWHEPGCVDFTVHEKGYQPLFERLFDGDFEGRIGPPPGKRIKAKWGSKEAFDAGCASLIDRGMKIIYVPAPLDETI